MIEKFKDILLETASGMGDDFSGFGLILYEEIADIPIFPLREAEFNPLNEGIVKCLKRMSRLGNEFHDGFHLISSEFELTHASQYFSPPIVKDIKVDRSKYFGGRFMAGLFGSLVKGVVMTGIATRGNGIVIFKTGKEIYKKELI